MGRLKFAIKDFRTDSHPANSDLKRQGMIERSASPIKQRNRRPDVDDDDGGDKMGDGLDIDSDNEFAEEEAVEIDCGVVGSHMADGSEIQCKVCWGNEQTKENPLLNSCKCDGSVRFIHFECLKFWLKQKMTRKEESNHISYIWK